MDLPDDWSIEGPFSEQPGSATSAHLPTGIGWYRKRFSIGRHASPQARIIGTESPSMGGSRGDYRGLFLPSPGVTLRGMSSNRGIDVEQLWKLVRIYDCVSGDHMWTGIDYLGESMWPAKNSSAGVLDTCGFEKDGYYFYQSQWSSKTVLHVFPHWNWRGRVGEVIWVLCYTNCDSVELFLNGKSLGIQGYWFPRSAMQEKYNNYPARRRAPCTRSDLHLTWTVPYQSGTMKAMITSSIEPPWTDSEAKGTHDQNVKG